jgi:hypothetical protein
MVYLVESLFQQRVARLPTFWQNMVVKLLTRHYHSKYKHQGTLSREKFTIKDSEHAVRDRWTPLYAHRHTFKEVIEWFQDKGLDYKLIDTRAYQEKIGIPLTGIGIRGASRAYFEKAARNSQATEELTGQAKG